MTFEAVHKKACPGCGAAFSCGSAQGGCWCEGLPRLTPVAEVDCRFGQVTSRRARNGPPAPNFTRRPLLPPTPAEPRPGTGGVWGD